MSTSLMKLTEDTEDKRAESNMVSVAKDIMIENVVFFVFNSLKL